jgi:hypothetical protein
VQAWIHNQGRNDALVNLKLVNTRGLFFGHNRLPAVENLTVIEVTEIAGEAARHVSADFRVIGVTIGGGGDYVEVLLNIEGCHQAPCQLSLGVFRNHTKSAVRLSLEAKLRLHLAQKRNS